MSDLQIVEIYISLRQLKTDPTLNYLQIVEIYISLRHRYHTQPHYYLQIVEIYISLRPHRKYCWPCIYK